MRKTKKIKYLITPFALFSCISLLHADVKYANKPNANTSEAKAPNSFFNPPGRPEVKNGLDLFITADYLIWQALEQNVTAWEKGGFITLVGTNADRGTFHSPRFDWKSGARIGVGYNIGHDQWDTSLTWTWFEDDASNHGVSSAKGTIEGVISSPLFSVTSHKASSHLGLALNVLDLELGKEFYTSNWFTLRPFAGIRNAWVNQHWRTKFDDVISTNFIGQIEEFKVRLKQKFWGIGPRAGLNAEFGLIRELSIFSNTSLSLLYGFFKNTRTENSVTLQNVKTRNEASKKSAHSEQAIADLQLGLRWDHLINRERYHIRLQAGWEHHIFFDHNHFYNFSSGGSYAIDNLGGNLGFQGWFLSGRFDF